MNYEVRRTGDGLFYLVSVDEEGSSKEIYSEGKLMKFASSAEAKETIEDLGTYEKIPNKKRRVF